MNYAHLIPIVAVGFLASMLTGCTSPEPIKDEASKQYDADVASVTKQCGDMTLDECDAFIRGLTMTYDAPSNTYKTKPLYQAGQHMLINPIRARAEAVEETAQTKEVAQPEQSPKPQFQLEQAAQAHPVPVLAKVASSDGRPVGKAWEALSDREKAQWYAKDAAYEHGVPFPLMHSLFWHESGFNPKAYNNCDAAGVGQMIEATARGMGLKTSVIRLKKPMRCGKYLIWHKATPADERFDAKKNIQASVKYFAGLRKHYGNDKLALVHYNGGRRAVNAWLKANGYRESRHYVSSIMSNAQRMGYGG